MRKYTVTYKENVESHLVKRVDIFAESDEDLINKLTPFIGYIRKYSIVIC